MMCISPKLAAGLVAAIAATTFSTSVQAQAPAKPAKNLVSNGSFESSFRREDLWDGVDAAGYLSGDRGAVPILTSRGKISDSAMPISVAVADMNNDNLPDIVTMDVLSYLRIYFNSGTATEPKFTTGDLGGIFISRTYSKDIVLGDLDDEAAKRSQLDESARQDDHARQATRMFPSDILRTGKKDLIVGNYVGEILLIPNAGSAQTPDFKQPADIGKAAIPTMKDSNKKWGNVFAPTSWDWDGDGKEDLLLGEGSYSANNIHLLINQGSAGRPTFDENNRHVIAFGDGLEQLTPTVVDYNGDGVPDLLVSERSGKIAVYLNNGKKPKRGEAPEELPFSSFISKAGSSTPLSFGGICTVSTGDLNGDGLFDLLVGKTNGRVAMALNTGTKTEPKFATPVDLKGTSGTKPFAIPSGWDVNYGLDRGNFYGFVTSVKVAEDENIDPPDGKAVLKVGYLPSANTIMPKPSTYTPAFPGWKPGGIAEGWGASRRDKNAPAEFFRIRQDNRFKFKNETSYTLSFKVKGRFRNGEAAIRWRAHKQLSEARVTQGERGSARVQRNEVQEIQNERVNFSGGSGWTEVKKTFKVSFRDKDLKDLPQTSSTDLDISFSIPLGEVAYIDDVQIVEQ